MGKLYDGTRQLKDGTEEFSERMDTIDDEITDEADRVIAEKTGKDVSVRSFTSSRNGEVDSVQFVISVPAVEKPEEAETEAPQEERKGFLDKLRGLFQH